MINSLLHLVYPALCFHCKELLVSHKTWLCPACAELVTLIDPKRRCQKCFKESGSFVCRICGQKRSYYNKLAVCFDHFGPAASLLNAFKERLFLDQVLASWMVVQMDKAAFPLPDLIVPFPCTAVDKILEGYNRALLLAQKIGRLYQVPVKELLKRSESSLFFLKKKCQIRNKKICLIVEKMEAIELMAECAKELQKGSPSSIHLIACTFTETA